MFEGIPFASLTAPTLLGITVLLILLGRLVPRSALKDKDKQIDAWKKAAETAREGLLATSAQTAELLEVAKTTNSIVVATFGTPEQRARESGGTNVVPTKKQ